MVCKPIILIAFTFLFIGLLTVGMIKFENYQDSKGKLEKLNSEKDHLRAPDIHDSEKQNNTEPDIHDSEKQNNTEPDIHDSEIQNNAEPDIHDSEKQNNTEPDIHDSEKQNNTENWEFERIVLEIEEQESLRDKYFNAFVAYLCASCVGTPFLLMCAFVILESARHPEEGAEACLISSFFTSRFCPLSQEGNETAPPLRVPPPDTEESSVLFQRTRAQDGVLETAEILPRGPLTSNESER